MARVRSLISDATDSGSTVKSSRMSAKRAVAPGLEDRVEGGREAERRGDDLVAGAQPKCLQRGDQGNRPITHRDGVGNAAHLGELCSSWATTGPAASWPESSTRSTACFSSSLTCTAVMATGGMAVVMNDLRCLVDRRPWVRSWRGTPRPAVP